MILTIKNAEELNGRVDNGEELKIPIVAEVRYVGGPGTPDMNCWLCRLDGHFGLFSLAIWAHKTLKDKAAALGAQDIIREVLAPLLEPQGDGCLVYPDVDCETVLYYQSPDSFARELADDALRMEKRFMPSEVRVGRALALPSFVYSFDENGAVTKIRDDEPL